MTTSEFFDVRDAELKKRGQIVWDYVFAGITFVGLPSAVIHYTNGAPPRGPTVSETPRFQLFAALAPTLMPMPYGIEGIKDTTAYANFIKSRLYRPTLQMADMSYVSYYGVARPALTHLMNFADPSPPSDAKTISQLQRLVDLIMPSGDESSTLPRFHSTIVTSDSHPQIAGAWGDVGPFNVDGKDEWLSFNRCQIGIFGWAGRQFTRVFEPIMRRNRRQFGRALKPRWEKEHDIILKGKKFTRNAERMKKDPNDKGLGKSGTEEWRKKSLRIAKQAIARAAFDAISDGFDKWKTPKTKKQVEATVKDTVRSRLARITTKR